MNHSDSPLAKFAEIRRSRDKQHDKLKTVNREYISPAENFCFQTVVIP